jgi:hypothetical protein
LRAVLNDLPDSTANVLLAVATSVANEALQNGAKLRFPKKSKGISEADCQYGDRFGRIVDFATGWHSRC